MLEWFVSFLIIKDFPEFTGPVKTCKEGSIFTFSDNIFISLLQLKNSVDEHASDEHLLLCENSEENGNFHLYGGKRTRSILLQHNSKERKSKQPILKAKQNTGVLI